MPPSQKNLDNFNTLCRAIQACDAALLECESATTGEQLAVICAMNRFDNGFAEFVPLAILLDDKLQEIVLPTVPDDPDFRPEHN